MTWMDLTIRANTPAEITEQPDGSMELSWPAPEVDGRLTVLVSRDELAHVVSEGRGLLGEASLLERATDATIDFGASDELLISWTCRGEPRSVILPSGVWPRLHEQVEAHAEKTRG